MELKSPYLLVLIPVCIVLFVLWKRRFKQPAFKIPTVNLIEGMPQSFRARFSQWPDYLRWMALLVLVLALCGPRKVLDQTLVTSEGIDIILAMDISGSMAAEDFSTAGKRQNRLEAVKSVVNEFIDQRQNDRLGLVVFGSKAYTVCPLTTDHRWLKENLSRVRLGLVQDGTAMGSGISSSLLRLKQSTAKSKIIILLTDGVNNAGRIDPLQAAQMAKALKVKIYTIGAGTKGVAPMPVDLFGQIVYRNVPVDIDEETLSAIAKDTGARYFRATDADSLRQIYREIDALEKTKIETKGYRQYQELFWILVLLALSLLALEFLLANTVLLRIP